MKTRNKAAGACSTFNRFNTCQQTAVSVHHQLVYVSLSKAHMTSLVSADIIRPPSVSLCALHFSLNSSTLSFSIITLLSLYMSASNFPVSIHLPQISLFYSTLPASVVHIVVLTHLSLSFSPSSPFCMQVNVDAREAAQQYKTEQKR